MNDFIYDSAQKKIRFISLTISTNSSLNHEWLKKGFHKNWKAFSPSANITR